MTTTPFGDKHQFHRLLDSIQDAMYDEIYSRVPFPKTFSGVTIVDGEKIHDWLVSKQCDWCILDLQLAAFSTKTTGGPDWLLVCQHQLDRLSARRCVLRVHSDASTVIAYGPGLIDTAYNYKDDHYWGSTVKYDWTRTKTSSRLQNQWLAKHQLLGNEMSNENKKIHQPVGTKMIDNVTNTRPTRVGEMFRQKTISPLIPLQRVVELADKEGDKLDISGLSPSQLYQDTQNKTYDHKSEQMDGECDWEHTFPCILDN
jgi:hypothetical protein